MVVKYLNDFKFKMILKLRLALLFVDTHEGSASQRVVKRLSDVPAAHLLRSTERRYGTICKITL